MVAAKIQLQKNVDNPAGLLIHQVPRFFPGTELTAYRGRKAREIAEGRETAQRVLTTRKSRQRPGSGLNRCSLKADDRSWVMFMAASPGRFRRG